MLYKDIHKLPPSFKILNQNSKLMVELDESTFQAQEFSQKPRTAGNSHLSAGPK